MVSLYRFLQAGRGPNGYPKYFNNGNKKMIWQSKPKLCTGNTSGAMISTML